MTTEVFSRTFQSSELSRNSKAVFEAAEKTPVTVTRRDGDNFVLMTEHEADDRRKMFEIAAQIIAATTLETGTLSERMSQFFPWMLALTPENKALCAQELVDAARASFSTNQPQLLLIEMSSWKDSATAIAAGLHRFNPDFLQAPFEVERP